MWIVLGLIHLLNPPSKQTAEKCTRVDGDKQRFNTELTSVLNRAADVWSRRVTFSHFLIVCFSFQMCNADSMTFYVQHCQSVRLCLAIFVSILMSDSQGKTGTDSLFYFFTKCGNDLTINLMTWRIFCLLFLFGTVFGPFGSAHHYYDLQINRIELRFRVRNKLFTVW